MSVSEDMTPTFSIAGLLAEDMTSTFSIAGLLAEFMMSIFSIAWISGSTWQLMAGAQNLCRCFSFHIVWILGKLVHIVI